MLKSLSIGCVVLVYTKIPIDFADKDSKLLLENNFVDAVACYVARTKISIQISKEHKHSFELRYNLTPSKQADDNLVEDNN